MYTKIHISAAKLKIFLVKVTFLYIKSFESEFKSNFIGKAFKFYKNKRHFLTSQINLNIILYF